MLQEDGAEPQAAPAAGTAAAAAPPAAAAPQPAAAAPAAASGAGAAGAQTQDLAAALAAAFQAIAGTTLDQIMQIIIICCLLSVHWGLCQMHVEAS